MRQLAPNSLQHCRLTGGRSATELAVIDAFKRRQGKNKALGFAGASHGQGLAMSQFAHPNMSLGALNWPVLNYPANGTSDEQVLDSVRKAITNDVAVVLVEPVNWQSGNQMSGSLISQIGRIAHEHDALLVVDETNTGCGATGKGFWASDASEADYVAFGKRTQVTGYYSNQGDNVELGGQEHNVALMCEINKQLNEEKLIERVASVGQSLGQKVKDAAAKSSRITGVNSAGTMMWINTGNAKDAFELRDHLRRHGVLVKLNGAHGVVTKPSLTLEEQHAQPLVSAVANF